MIPILQGTKDIEDLIDASGEFRLLGSGFRFTEGPSWNTRGDYLVFSDIPDDARWKWSERGGMELVMRPNFMGNGTVYEPDGSLLVCEQISSSVTRFRPDGGHDIVAFHYKGKYLNSPNDIVTKSDGSIYFTDPNYGRWPGGFVGLERPCDLDFQGVYRVPPGGGDCELVVDEHEFEQPNGLCFSPDESVLYIDDRTELKAFDVEPDGTLSHPRVLQSDMGSSGGAASGNPDGMKCDELGNIWCTARHGVWIISPAGDVLGIIETPDVTGNLVWGGEGFHDLYLMTKTTVHVIKTRVASAPLPYH